ncbi:MAG TPA: hypothetical protein VFX41_02955, partial [Actinomycetales bacterium]|nr:hypothetical protein [Actinomycetales bacterium]
MVSGTHLTPSGPSRRTVLRAAGAGFGLFFVTSFAGRGYVVEASAEQLAEVLPGGTLAPTDVTKFVSPLLVPPVMPRSGRLSARAGAKVDYYEISLRQFEQQILPEGMPATAVWGYGPES